MATATDAQNKAKKRNEDIHNAHPLPEIEIGTLVRVQDPKSKKWDQSGRIIAKNDEGNSYEVETDDCIIRRNRRFIRIKEGGIS